MVAERKAIGVDDGAGDGGQVVLEEGLGRSPMGVACPGFRTPVSCLACAQAAHG